MCLFVLAIFCCRENAPHLLMCVCFLILSTIQPSLIAFHTLNILLISVCGVCRCVRCRCAGAEPVRMSLCSINQNNASHVDLPLRVRNIELTKVYGEAQWVFHNVPHHIAPCSVQYSYSLRAFAKSCRVPVQKEKNAHSHFHHHPNEQRTQLASNKQAS